MSLFVKAEGKKLYEVVMAQIREVIINGQLSAGDLLPPEGELASSLGVSRTTIREALRALEILGIIETRRGVGTVVRSITAKEVMEKIGIVLADINDVLLKLTEVRSIIEPEVARLAAQRCDRKCAEEMQKALAMIEKDIDSGGTGNEGAVIFHKVICDSIDNEILSHFVSEILEIEKKSREVTLQVPGRRHKSLKEHEDICEAIIARDAGKAADLMKRHIDSVYLVLKSIRQDKAP
jgi:GntR family transcriptional repressor for pyruvate dehydrogenase complex